MNYLLSNTVISKPGGSAGSDFLRISDKKPGEDVAGDGKSPADTAAALEDIFSGFTPSQDSGLINQEALADFLRVKYSGADGSQRLAEDVGVDDLCPSTMAPTGKRVVPVYVHASRNAIFENYDLVAYGSATDGPKILEATVNKSIEFSGVSFISIGYYLQSDQYSVKFVGVTGQDGKSVDDPVYNISSEGIHLHGVYSGTVKITGLQIMYHVWDITLTGIALDGGQRLYSGRASVIAKAYGLGPYHQKVGGEITDDAAAQCPFGDQDLAVGDPGREPECFVQVKNEVKGSCSGQLLEPIFFTYKSVSCPDGVVPQWNNPSTYNYNPSLPEYYKIVDYVTSKTYRYDGDGVAVTPAEYEEICCHPPEYPTCIPQCRSIKSTFYGVEIQGGRQKYIDEYDGLTRFVPVGTEAGPCGTLTDTFVDPSGITCCKNTEPIIIDQDSIPAEIDSAGFFDAKFSGGKFPLTATLSGSDEFSFEPGYVSKTKAIFSGYNVRIYTFDTCNAQAQLTVEDSCYNIDTAELSGLPIVPCAAFDPVYNTGWTVAEAREFATVAEAQAWRDSLDLANVTCTPGGNQLYSVCLANPEYYIAVGNDYQSSQHYYGYVCLNSECQS